MNKTNSEIIAEEVKKDLIRKLGFENDILTPDKVEGILPTIL